jgi:hypothetical protein
MVNTPGDSCATASLAASVWPDSAEAERSHVSAADKRIAELRARFAMAGWVAHVIGPDQLVIGRWGRWRDCTVVEAEELVGKLEGQHHAR